MHLINYIKQLYATKAEELAEGRKRLIKLPTQTRRTIMTLILTPRSNDTNLSIITDTERWRVGTFD